MARSRRREVRTRCTRSQFGLRCGSSRRGSSGARALSGSAHVAAAPLAAGWVVKGDTRRRAKSVLLRRESKGSALWRCFRGRTGPRSGRREFRGRLLDTFWPLRGVLWIPFWVENSSLGVPLGSEARCWTFTTTHTQFRIREFERMQKIGRNR